MDFNMNSGLLNVPQPCCYWEFDDYLYGLEQREDEWRKECAEEVVDAMVDGKPVLQTRRMDLPSWHEEYDCPQECILDWDGAQKVIAKCWLDTLEDWIAERFSDEGFEGDIKLAFKGVDSPREYNFRGDECDFTMSISLGTLAHIVGQCLVTYRAGFSDYLARAHSSRDGYMSYISNSVYDYDDMWALLAQDGGECDADDIKHLVWVCLDYWLFGIEDMENGDKNELDGDGMEKRFGKNQDKFRSWLWDKVMDAEGNGAFNMLMEYRPKEVVGA